MPVNDYECLFLLDPTKSAGNLDGAKAQLHATLEKFGSEILASRLWDDRKLAYPVRGHKKGQYYLIYFRMESRKLGELQHDFRLNELILRFMVQAIPAKWANEMLEVARDEHRFGFQMAHEEPSDSGEVGEGGIPSEELEGESGRGGRRGRRSPVEAADAKD